MNMAGMSLMLTIFVLNIYHHSPSKPVPVLLVKLVHKLLARVLCMHAPVITDTTPVETTVQHADGDAEKNTDEVRESNWKESEMISADHRYSLLPVDILIHLRDNMEEEKKKGIIEINRDQWNHGCKSHRPFLLGSVVHRDILNYSRYAPRSGQPRREVAQPQVEIQKMQKSRSCRQ